MPYDKATNSYYVDPALEAQQQQLLMQAAAPTKLQQKQSKLQAKLAGLLQDSSYNQGSSNLNNLTAEQQQLLLSDMNDAALYHDGNGGYYQIDPITQAKIPYTKTNKYGKLDTRDLYIGQTADDYMKLGLARTDRGGFKGTYDGSGGSTVHKTGPKGIQPGQDPLFNITLPYNTATMYEQLTHQNIGQIKSRVGGPSKRNEIQKALGDGYNEYTTQNAPLWNINYKDDGTQLERVTARPHEGDTYVMENARLHQPQGSDPLFIQGQPATGEGYNLDGGDSYLGSIADSAQFGVGSFAASAADALVDTSARGVKELYKYFGNMSEEEANKAMKEDLTFSKDWFDDNMNFTKADKWKQKEAYGYSGKRTDEAQKEFSKAWDSGDPFEMAKAIGKGAVTAGPQFFGESLGYMLGVSNPYSASLAVIGQANDWMDDFLKNHDRKELTLARRAAITAGSALSSLIEKTGVDAMLGNSEVIKGVVSLIKTSGSKSMAKNLAQNVAKQTVKVAGKTGYEGLEEAAQQVVEEYVKKYGTDKEKELYDGTLSKDMFTSFAAGVGTAGATTGPVHAAQAVKDSIPDDKIAAFADKFKRDNYVDEKALYEDNPDLNKDELKEAVKGVKEAAGASLATPSSDDLADAPLEPQEAPSRDVSAAVVGATKKVADVQDEGVEESEDLKKFTDEFDTEYNTFVNNFRGMTAGIKDGSATTEAFDEGAFVRSVNEGAKSEIDNFLDIAEDMKKAGAGPKRLAAVQDKINALAALTTAQTTDEMHTIIHSNKTSTPAKVSSVLGSSAATIDDIDEVLKQEDLDEVQRTSLEAKKDILKNVRNVGKEKLFGTGSKPGVFTWISRLASGKVDKATVNGINDFIAGQVSKLDTFKNAVAKWDSENKMPWADPSHPDYKAYNDPKNLNYKTLNNPNAINSKHAIRRSIMDRKGMLNKLREPIKVEYGDIVRRNDVQQTAGLVDTLEAEHKAMMKLQDALDLALGARKGTKKASKVEGDTKGPVEYKKAPTSSKSKTADTAEKPVKKEPYRAPSEEDISKMTVNEVTRAQKELADAVGDNAPTTEDSLVAAQLKMRAEDLAKDKSSPSKETSTKLDNNGELIMKDSTLLANSGNGKYNLGIKEQVLSYINSNKAIKAKLTELGIDVKDC